MAETGVLFTVRNHFYLGAYQAAIAEASDLEDLTDAEKVERDIYVYRAYIELGSYEVGMRVAKRLTYWVLACTSLYGRLSTSKQRFACAAGNQ